MDLKYTSCKGEKDNCKNKPETTCSSVDNHIYFYDGINDESILELKKSIYDVSIELTKMKFIYKDDFNPKIYLHINSGGGYVSSGLNGLDIISNSEIPIITIAEGSVASAATLLFLAGTERWITKNTFILIHQIRTGFWGTHEEMRDEIVNMDMFEKKIIDFYVSKSKLNRDQIKKIMDRELLMESETCLKKGFVDKII